MQLDPAKPALLYGFFEAYLKLNEQEELIMHEEITKLPNEEAKKGLSFAEHLFYRK